MQKLKPQQLRSAISKMRVEYAAGKMIADCSCGKTLVIQFQHRVGNGDIAPAALTAILQCQPIIKTHSPKYFYPCSVNLNVHQFLRHK